MLRTTKMILLSNETLVLCIYITDKITSYSRYKALYGSKFFRRFSGHSLR